MAGVAIVVDLGFGDAGKGLVTDFLTRRMAARTVVRFNGGAQAGHNVVTSDGRHHTFSQLGAGSFVPGVRTFLAREVVVDPLALALEARVLAGKLGEDPLERLAVDADARVITPFHRATNRIRERARGEAAHGSCGVGFGETVQDSLQQPADTVRFGQLGSLELREILSRVRERKRAECEELAGGIDPRELASERAVFEDASLIDRWLERVRAVARRVTVGDRALLARWLREGPAVFEGAQGVLLDERHGFAPHTTWSDCTFAPALELLREARLEEVPVRYGVLRSHVVRHGAGPLPTQTPALEPLVREHNRSHPFQGRVRYGWFDAVLARYALDAVGGVDRLVLTHADLLDRARVQASPAYRRRGATLERLPRVSDGGELTDLVSAAEALLDHLPPGRKGGITALEGLLGREIDLAASGPTADHVTVRSEAFRA